MDTAVNGIKSYPLDVAEEMELFLKDLAICAEEMWIQNEASRILKELNG
jgi:hypothetical protein